MSRASVWGCNFSRACYPGQPWAMRPHNSMRKAVCITSQSAKKHPVYSKTWQVTLCKPLCFARVAICRSINPVHPLVRPCLAKYNFVKWVTVFTRCEFGSMDFLVPSNSSGLLRSKLPAVPFATTKSWSGFAVFAMKARKEVRKEAPALLCPKNS